MEFAYKDRKYTTKVSIASIVFILLLLLNFTAMTGICSHSNLENTVPSQLNEFKYCIVLNNTNIISTNDPVQIKQLSDSVSIDVIIGCVLLLLIHFIWTYRSKLFYARRCTLVSLCIRKDE